MRQIRSAAKDSATRHESSTMRGLIYAILLSLVVWVGAFQLALIFR